MLERGGPKGSSGNEDLLPADQRGRIGVDLEPQIVDRRSVRRRLDTAVDDDLGEVGGRCDSVEGVEPRNTRVYAVVVKVTDDHQHRARELRRQLGQPGDEAGERGEVDAR